MADSMNLEEVLIASIQEHCELNGIPVPKLTLKTKPLDIPGLDSLLLEEISAKVSAFVQKDIPTGIMYNKDRSFATIEEISKRISSNKGDKK